VEPQVHLHEPGHGLDVVVRVPQGPHPVARHPCSHDLVVMEGDAVRPDATGGRLADVMEQSSETQQSIGAGLVHHGDRVGEHVLVPVDRVLLEGQRRQLGQELAGEPGLAQEPETVARPLDRQQLVELVAYALA
jgi:hypothetical protein